jgi:hypothetical protein
MPAEISVTRAWPWGLTLVTDSAITDELPASLEGRRVVGLASGLVCAVIHETEGTATVTVHVGQAAPRTVVPEFDGMVAFPSGGLRVSDIGQAEYETLAVTPGQYRAVVIVDEPNEPTEVQIWLEQVG